MDTISQLETSFKMHALHSDNYSDDVRLLNIIVNIQSVLFISSE